MGGLKLALGVFSSKSSMVAWVPCSESQVIRKEILNKYEEKNQKKKKKQSKKYKN
jgi:hypothetical protein